MRQKYRFGDLVEVPHGWSCFVPPGGFVVIDEYREGDYSFYVLQHGKIVNHCAWLSEKEAVLIAENWGPAQTHIREYETCRTA